MSTDSRSFDHSPLALEACYCSSSTIRALDSPLRRRVMQVLLERREVEFAELSSLLSALPENAPFDDSSFTHQAMVTTLHHTHIPKLEASGLISRNRDTGALAVTLHPDIYRGPLTEHLLSSVDPAVWTAVAAVHRDEKRGAVLSLLSQSEQTQTLESLASRLAESSPPEVGRSVGIGETETDERITLHHVHLPVLDQVGLVDYDTTSGIVTYTGDQWFDIDEFVATLPLRMRAEL
ncbi:hypothetical protein [Haloferax sp. DFSO52]|uniref:DUF7344 domain-containing protein n=1 Tax=Haloferax sp. DFSO52 TaxID=3388505 RepID=UPI003A8594E3